MDAAYVAVIVLQWFVIAWLLVDRRRLKRDLDAAHRAVLRRIKQRLQERHNQTSVSGHVE